MGTKRNPGQFDCYSKADPDEPIFVLRGKDPSASTLVRAWVVLREHLVDENIIERDEKQILEALDVAMQLDKYARDLGKEQALDLLRQFDPLGGDTEVTEKVSDDLLGTENAPKSDSDTEG